MSLRIRLWALAYVVFFIAVLVGTWAIHRADAAELPPKVTFAGDSISIQSGLTGAAYPNTLMHAGIGWSVSDAWAYVNNDYKNGHADVAVWALWTNDSRPPSQGGDGWSQNDVNLARWATYSAPASTCLVVVLPGLGDQADVGHQWGVIAARIFLKYTLVPELRNAGRHVEMVDWQHVLWDHPEYLDADGVHLAKQAGGPYGLSTTAGEARRAMIQEGIDAC